MRVALLRTYCDAANVSMHLYANYLASALRELRVDVEEIAPEPLVPSALRHGALSRADSLWGRFVRFPRAVRRLEADVFHVLDHSQAHLVAALDPSRTVVTCHDLMLLVLAAGRLPTTHREPMATAIFRYSVGHLRRARCVIAVSQNTRRDLIEMLEVDPARIQVIAPGLNTIPTSPTPVERQSARWRLRVDGPIVLHVGHTGFYKNVEGCLRILALVRASGIDAILLRAGEKLRPAQQRLADALGVAAYVRDLGRLDASGLRSAYAAADALLFPSLYEGFGLPVLEAMAFGLPVVCSDAGALPEIGRDAAITAAPDDHRALADAVARVLSDPREAEWRRRRGTELAAAYRWDTSARRVLDAYAACSSPPGRITG
jgi:glycosyltransferase involved in cell wall biosynthesis